MGSELTNHNLLAMGTTIVLSSEAATAVMGCEFVKLSIEKINAQFSCSVF